MPSPCSRLTGLPSMPLPSTRTVVLVVRKKVPRLSEYVSFSASAWAAGARPSAPAATAREPASCTKRPDTGQRITRLLLADAKRTLERLTAATMGSAWAAWKWDLGLIRPRPYVALAPPPAPVHTNPPHCLDLFEF